MNFNNNNNNRKPENEIGRVEAIKHTEWLLIGFFLFYAVIRKQINIIEFLFFITGTQFPDILEAILFKLDFRPEGRRLYTHSFLFPILLAILFFIYFQHDTAYYLFTVAYFGHLTLDMFAGGDPVYFFSPIFPKFKLIIINKEKRLKIGDYVYKKLGYLWENGTNGDLAWFWILQFFGSILGAVSFCIYLLSLKT